MQLEHSFVVPVGVDEAWTVLTDIERVAPCMPGASLDTVDGDSFTGTVRIKLGPISLTYKGQARFVALDETAHRAVLDAQGRDSRGNGTATARVSAQLRAVDAGTEVAVVTDLDITGKPAQFGRGVMVDVGNKLIGQFAERLAGTIAGPEATDPPPPATISAAPRTAPLAGAQAPAGPRSSASDDVAPIDLLSSVGPAAAKRLLPLLAGLLVLVLVIRRRGGRRAGTAPR